MKNIERILCAAIKYYKGIYLGYRHGDCIEVINDIYPKPLVTTRMQGFLTSKNRFVYRKEAGEIAFKAGQIDKPTDCLFSEDLY